MVLGISGGYAERLQWVWEWLGGSQLAGQDGEVHVGTTYLRPMKINWLVFYLVLAWGSYRFISPFYFIYHTELKAEGRRQLALTYIYLSNFLYLWCILATMVHVPTKGFLDMDFRDPVGMFFPLFIASFSTLMAVKFFLMFVQRFVYYFNYTFSFSRSLGEAFHNSALVSAGCCAHYAYCSSNSGGGPMKLLTRIDGDDPLCFYVTRGSDGFAFPPLLILWVTGIGLILVHLFFQRVSGYGFLSGGSFLDEEEDEDNLAGPPPEVQQPMVPWYSLFTSVTAVNLLISLKIFLGRFDMRTMQASLATAQSHIHGSDHPNRLYFDSHADAKDLWFDFMADCGDGFNSSYEIARLLAQPKLSAQNHPDDGPGQTELPRGDLLFIGGDLAYPHPDPEIFESRLFLPFEAAMPPPPHYDSRTISTNKPDIPAGVNSLKDYPGPQAFLIPGNHDWFDGLETFLRYICHRNWIGGWLMPQTRSYFAHKLPKGWWVFGVDNALSDDVDLFQYQYFAKVAESFEEGDCVIILTHSPSWILDDYYSKKCEENLRHFMDTVLKGRVAARIAGDIHNYTRHEISEDDMVRPAPAMKSSKSLFSMASSPIPIHRMRRSSSFAFRGQEVDDSYDTPTLVVSGGGGAFLHPTHVPSSEPIKVGSQELEYVRAAEYPSAMRCRILALRNIFQFRRKNWRFDVVGGVVYFVLVASVMPVCNVTSKTDAAVSTAGTILAFISTALDVMGLLFNSSLLSLFVSLFLLVACICFVDDNLPAHRRVIIGMAHAFVHFFMAVSVLLFCELALHYGVEHGMLGKGRLGFRSEIFQESFGPLWSTYEVVDDFTGGMVTFVIRRIPHVFDVPESIALKRIEMCNAPAVGDVFATFSRYKVMTYFLGMLLYYFVLSVPLVSGVFGTYLWFSVNFLGQHWNEAFSSLRIEDYKNFLRMHITPSGDVEVFVIGVDKVPRRWVGNQLWSGSKRRQFIKRSAKSYEWNEPSKWVPADEAKATRNRRIVDKFTIHRPCPLHLNDDDDRARRQSF